MTLKSSRNERATASGAPQRSAVLSWSDESTVLKARRRRAFLLAWFIVAALLVVSFWRLTSGDWVMSWTELGEALRHPGRADTASTVLWRLRLPRLLSALAAGALLSLAGLVLQALLGNPLAEPYTLGIAAGAAFGGALAFMTATPVLPWAFGGALSALWLSSTIAWRAGGGTGSLVLAGIVVSSVLSAGVTLLKALADDRLSAIVLWLMGSLAGASVGSAAVLWGFVFLFLTVSWLAADRLDALALGRSQAQLLGAGSVTLQWTLMALASLAAAVVVAHCGIIGFVGLVVPHLMRLAVGAGHRRLVPLVCLGGALLLGSADGAAQHLGELPVGVITALLGGPLFCHILIRRRSSS